MLNKQKNIDTNTLNLLPLAVILFDNEKIYFLNEKAISLFKIPRKLSEKLNLLSIYSFLDKEYHNATFENTKLVLQGKEFPPTEFPIINYKKEIVFLEAKSNAVYFEGKKVIQSTFFEINDRIKVNVDLEQKWNNFKNLFDSSPIGIFIHKGYCIYSNKTAARILEENNPDKLIGKNLIDFIIPKEQQRAKDRMAKAIKGEKFPDLTSS